jgi:protein-tyrosine phosphatase
MHFDRTLDESALFRVCFVCTGNICRSPMAESVFLAAAARAGLQDSIGIMSAGTGDWHVGERADERTIEALTARGYDGSKHRARQFDPEWFSSLDLIVVFDRGQERILRAWAGSEDDRAKIRLLTSFEPGDPTVIDVPDPYYSDAETFDRVLGIIERASTQLFHQIEPGLRGVS